MCGACLHLRRREEAHRGDQSRAATALQHAVPLGTSDRLRRSLAPAGVLGARRARRARFVRRARRARFARRVGASPLEVDGVRLEERQPAQHAALVVGALIQDKGARLGLQSRTQLAQPPFDASESPAALRLHRRPLTHGQARTDRRSHSRRPHRRPQRKRHRLVGFWRRVRSESAAGIVAPVVAPVVVAVRARVRVTPLIALAHRHYRRHRRFIAAPISAPLPWPLPWPLPLHQRLVRRPLACSDLRGYPLLLEAVPLPLYQPLLLAALGSEPPPLSHSQRGRALSKREEKESVDDVARERRCRDRTPSGRERVGCGACQPTQG